MNILVTGAKGMVGTALVNNLKNIRDNKNRTRPELHIDEIYEYDIDSSKEDLEQYCRNADFVFNLAGVNRPENPEDFMKGNFGFASELLSTLQKYNNKAPIMLSSSIDKKDSNKYLKAINEVASHAGIYGMIGGQVVDVESENKFIDKDKLDFIHLNKTAALIVACMRAGAIVGGANEDELQRITKYGKNIGLSFQIVDDILDITGDEAKLGKPIGSDIENHKSTYPSLLGLEKSREIARELIEEAKSSIEGFSSDLEFLKQLGDYIISRDC